MWYLQPQESVESEGPLLQGITHHPVMLSSLIAWTTNVWIILSYSRATSPSACVIASSGVWASSSCSKNLIHGCQVESICWFHCLDSQGSQCHWCQSNIHNVFLDRLIIHAASLCGRKASNSFMDVSCRIFPSNFCHAGAKVLPLILAPGTLFLPWLSVWFVGVQKP